MPTRHSLIPTPHCRRCNCLRPHRTNSIIGAMTDVLTRSQRSFCMSQIRGKHTNPELTVRRLLHSLGYRYRLHVRNLPGSPDLVFPSRRKLIFVHGCFWHRHRCKLGKPVPSTRRKFWVKKLTQNKLRDRFTRRQLRRVGWDVLTVWECQVRDIEGLTNRLSSFLDRRCLAHAPKPRRIK